MLAIASYATQQFYIPFNFNRKNKNRIGVAKKNYPSNITLSMDHSDNAARLVYETFYADEDVANDGDFTNRYNQEITKANMTLML